MKYFVLLLCLTVVNCSKKPKDCSDFKTGVFIHKNPDFSNWIILREDSIQTGIDIKDNSKLISSIEWLSDCNYSLTYKEVSENFKDSLIGTKINVNIINVIDNAYQYETNNGLYKTKGWIVKVKEKSF